jgi:hypothetical protein
MAACAAKTASLADFEAATMIRPLRVSPLV